MKVRKDIIYNFPADAAASSFNVIFCGGAQHANKEGWMMFTGDTVTPVDTIVDNSGATGLSQWFNFYDNYYVCGSKCKVSMNAGITAGGGEIEAMVATLVPTLGYCLGDDPVGNNYFDILGIDPGELPMAKRVLTKTSNAGQSVLSSYISIKRMLGCKDLSDASGSNNNFIVPRIQSATVTGQSIQPTANTADGIYWNLVLQNPQQYALTAGQANYNGATLRIQVTSYICFSGRKPLITV